ncbi:hypothetical protein [Streptomyces sp. NPDC057072]|uniref:hypothetical protein n=1 Tax=Streptomyces sp. NPDC057072 TaxID=3346014 RepID=UPI0036418530
MDFEVLKARFFEALDREDGSITHAAHAAGVNRNTAFGSARQAGVRGRGKPGTSGHPGRAEYERLRAAGVRRRDAAVQIGVHERTAQDWDLGIRQLGHSRLRTDGRLIVYKAGVTTTQPSLAAVDARLHPLVVACRRSGGPGRASARSPLCGLSGG